MQFGLTERQLLVHLLTSIDNYKWAPATRQLLFRLHCTAGVDQMVISGWAVIRPECGFLRDPNELGERIGEDNSLTESSKQEGSQAVMSLWSAVLLANRDHLIRNGPLDIPVQMMFT